MSERRCRLGRGGQWLLLAVLILAGMATQAGSAVRAQDEVSGEITFSFWGDPAELEAYSAVVEAFEAAQPGIDVEIAHVPGSSEFYAQVATGFAAGEPPDVFLINYRRYGQFAARGALEPLGSWLRESDVLREEDFYEPPLEAFRFAGGELVCLPQNVSSLVVYYNRDLFEAAGVPLPTAGWTWEDFLTAAQALTKDLDGDGFTDQYGLGVENSLIRFAPFIWQAGGDLVDDLDRPTRLTIDTAEARAGIQFVIDLSLKHKVVPTEPEVLAESDEDRFARGGSAMLLQSRRVVPTLRETATGFVWDVAPLPAGPAGPAGILHSDAYCMAASAEDMEAAWAFIEFAVGPEGAPIAAQTGRTVPSLRAVANSPAFLGLGAGGGSNPLLDQLVAPASSEVFLDTIPQIRRVPSISTWPEVEEAFNTTLGRAFYDEIPIDDAIALAQDRAESAFRRAAADGGR